MAKIKGETIVLKAVFTNDSGDPTSPSTPVTITVTKPDGNKDEDGTTVSEGATGVFEHNYTTSVVGTHGYKFTSADGAIEQDTFKVVEDKNE